MRELLAEFGATAIWPWVSGAFVLIGGIIVVALHPYWRGAAAVIVSLLGWPMMVRGGLLLAFPTLSCRSPITPSARKLCVAHRLRALHARQPLSSLRRLDRPSKELGRTSPRLDSRLAPRCLTVPSRQRRAPSQAKHRLYIDGTGRWCGLLQRQLRCEQLPNERGLVSAQPGPPGRWLRLLSAGARDPTVPARQPVRRRYRRSHVRRD